MAWRLAKSLETLRSQINAAHPNRNKASDGTIGDLSHAASASDHNPNDAGVVCAFDLTHDPAHGVDTYALADHMRTHRHPDLKYLVSNRRICSIKQNWAWRTYTGSDPHTSHVHISVGVGRDGQSRQPYDDTIQWDIGAGTNPVPVPQPKGVLVSKTLDFEAVLQVGKDGNGYVDVRHGQGVNPTSVSVEANGGISGGKYPTYSPQFWVARLEGQFVRITSVKNQPEAGFTILVSMNFA